MHTNTTHSTTTRRHQNPRCVCPACRAFDQSITLEMHCILTEPMIMTAIDTETCERFTYSYHQGVLRKMAVPPSDRCAPQKKSAVKPSFRTLLHDLVMERVEQSVKHHPFFWLCMSSLLH